MDTEKTDKNNERKALLQQFRTAKAEFDATGAVHFSGTFLWKNNHEQKVRIKKEVLEAHGKMVQAWTKLPTEVQQDLRTEIKDLDITLQRSGLEMYIDEVLGARGC